MSTIKTNLKFRILQEEDLETLRIWRMLPEVTKYLFTDPTITPEDQKEWFKAQEENYLSVYWMISSQDIDIGYASVFNIDLVNKHAEVGVCIADPKYRGKGLGKVVIRRFQELIFNFLDFHKLYALVLEDNTTALMSFLGCDWIQEGSLINHVLKDKFHNVVILSLFRKCPCE